VNPIRAALYTRLTGDATLTALLATPTSAYHKVAPQTAVAPFIVFAKQSGTPNRQFGGAHVQQELWLIKGISLGASASPAESIAARADTVLTFAPLAITGRALLAIYRESDISYAETVGADIYHHEGFLARIVTQPA
jgi:hypothetical protein